ncbi:MAG: hypothetical protein E6J90_48085 [Deltaproteobacteria bacterium]|nr:MAG: hypothetical protein E6J90_48085 [Deltaproteobacteria bacterium]
MSSRPMPLLVCLLAACGSTPRPGADRAAPPSPPPAPAPASVAAAPVAPALDPPQPTLRLPRNFVPTGYRARLAIDPARDGFTGSIEIAGRVGERSKGFWLHGRGLKVTAARLTRGEGAGGGAMQVDVAAVGEDLLSLHPAEPVDPGPVTIAMEYSGGFDLVQGTGAYRHAFDGVPYIETQFESISARRVFPCLDEPDSKVPWQLTLDVPRDLVAVANTAATGETAVDATTRRVSFAPTRPLPSYLIAFDPRGDADPDHRAQGPRPGGEVGGRDVGEDRPAARGLLRHPVPL